uniref:Uncharacterized protein n=1 Tax=Arion vulgaris TaxID=1028688 RepID=A0A0B7BNX6_9EUPU
MIHSEKSYCGVLANALGKVAVERSEVYRRTMSSMRIEIVTAVLQWLRFN